MANIPVKFSRDANAGPKSQGDFQLAYRFNVEIDGITQGGIVNVEGLGSENEIVDYQHSEEGLSRVRAGRLRMKPVVLTREWAANSEFIKWRQNVIDGVTDRRSVSIVCLSDAGEESMRFNLFFAWPSAWQGPDFNSKTSGHTVEKLTLQYEDMRVS
jgi:phage tail-like protein